VRGYRPTFRLAARQDGRLILFEADTNPRARVGRDLLDLEGKVRRISINSRADGRSELGAITDPKQVAAMVRMLDGGPVDQRMQPTSEQQSIWSQSSSALDAHMRKWSAVAPKPWRCRIAYNRRTRRSSNEIRETVSDRGRGVRSRGERPPTRAPPTTEKGTAS
jgi:hypothetical protein